MSKFTKEFVKRIPKTDLHVHLDGSLRLSTLIELAKRQNVKLPSYTEDGLRTTLFKSRYEDLNDYLKGFSYTCSVMNDSESLERISYELAYDAYDEGVLYIEVRFAPQLHISESMSFEDVMMAVDKGLKRAKSEINLSKSSCIPDFEYGIIVCAMRFCNEHFSEYYNNFFKLHKYSTQREIISFLSLELVKASVYLKNNSDVQIVGFDLAGSEYGFPADNHIEAYDYAHKHFLMKTVHAGEAYGPESIFQAITKLHAERIGHGLFLFDEDKIYSKTIKDKEKYVKDLSNYIAMNRITVEVCLTSNLQTVPELKDISMHPFQKMLDRKISATICTDNRLVSHTTTTKEIMLAINNFNIDRKTLKNIIIYGFKRSFYFHSYAKKRSYAKEVITYYEKIEKEELDKI